MRQAIAGERLDPRAEMGRLVGQLVDQHVALGEGKEGGAPEAYLTGQTQIVTELILGSGHH